MPDDFEYHIFQQMDSFHLNPDPQVWDRVAAALPPEKKRRRFAIWWLLPVALCLGGGLWLKTQRPKNSAAVGDRKMAGNQLATSDSSKPTTVFIPADTFSDSVIKKLVSHKNTIATKQLPTLRKVTISKEADAIEKPYRKEATPQRYSIAYKRPAKKILPRLSNSMVPFGYDSSTTSKPDASRALGDAGDVADDSDKNVLIHSDGEVVLPLSNNNELQMQRPVMLEPPIVYAKQNLLMMPSVSTLQPEVIKTDSPFIKEMDTAFMALYQAKKSVVKSKSTKAVWSVVFAAGSSSLNGNISSDEKTLAQNYNSSVGIGTNLGNGTIGSQADLRRFTNPKSSFGFNAGINRQQTINKHWSWQAQISYQNLSSKQLAGSRNDSISMSGFVADAYNARITTTQTIFTNRVHRVQLSPQIIYTLNPEAKLPFGLSVGMALAYNLTNHILLHDYRSGAYIRSAQLSNNLLLGGTLGADVFINKRLHAGFIFQHDFTNVAKSSVGSVFHWNQLQLKLGIPLSK